MRIIGMSVLLIIAVTSAQPLFAASIHLEKGFTSSPSWFGRVIAVLHATDEQDLGRVEVHVDPKVWITENGIQRASKQSSCGLVLGADVTCSSGTAYDVSVTDGIEYCADGKADYWHEDGYIYATLSPANAGCTTLTGLPPGGATASASFLGCHDDNCALWRFTFYAPRAAKYRIERRPIGGTWSHYDTVGGTSTTVHLGGNDLQWRVRGENAVGSGPWAYFNTEGKCNSGGPGGPGPID